MNIMYVMYTSHVNDKESVTKKLFALLIKYLKSLNLTDGSHKERLNLVGLKAKLWAKHSIHSSQKTHA